MSWITGAATTAFGRLPGRSTLDLMSEAATLALRDAQLERAQIDGLLCGYSTTLPHLMLATVFAEHFGLQPAYAHAVQVGGATGLAMLMLAHRLAESNEAEHVLVVAGEDRLSGQGRDATVLTLAQVGHPVYELPFGPTIPAYYALLASQYLHQHRVREEDLAEFAVLMRRHALAHPNAQFKQPITVADVMDSRVIATPLKLLDCCPVSDGGAAFVVSRALSGSRRVRIRGCGQAHRHQHVTQARAPYGASDALQRASRASGLAATDARTIAVYDSFTITLALLLEELGLAEPGQAGAMARAGVFGRDGERPLNLHGGLLSFGHCGSGGALAHLVETCDQMDRRAGERQVRDASIALLHGDGGVLSSHVSVFLEAA
jgi:acetyl-CoA acetyltransferase